jgi:hypothetical protein
MNINKRAKVSNCTDLRTEDEKEIKVLKVSDELEDYFSVVDTIY